MRPGQIIRKKVVRLTSSNPLSGKELQTWLAEFKMQIIRKTVVRVLHGYLKERSLCEDKFELLLIMEKRFCHQEP